jgi:hypothetical protein
MIYASTIRHAAVLGLCFFAACSPLQGPQEPALPGEIALSIHNNSQDALRCVTVLAHFITRDLPILQPGESLGITLGRDRGDGSLSYGDHGGKPMLLENILCGGTTDWTASRQDLPLKALRTAPADRFRVTCRGGGSLACDPPAAL